MMAVELRKQLRRWRTWIGLGIMAVLPAVITTIFAVSGGPKGDRPDRDLFSVATKSGLNMPLAALQALQAFLLVVVCVSFNGETVAGEANWGTLRYLLLRPVRRGRVLAAKLAVGALLTLLATVFISVVGLISGVAAFGWHPFLTPFGGVIAQGAAVLRLAAATGYVAWSLSGVICFAFLLSVLTDSTFGSVAGAVGFAVVSEILDAFSALGSVRYGLPTHYWQAWDSLFLPTTPGSDMIRGTLLQLPYVLVFCGLAWWWFARKDIVT